MGPSTMWNRMRKTGLCLNHETSSTEATGRQQERQHCNHPALPATLTGQLMLSTDQSMGVFVANPFTVGLLFYGSDRTAVTIEPINQTLSNGIHLTSTGGTGTFGSSQGSMSTSLTMHASGGPIPTPIPGTLNVTLTLTTELGDPHGPFQPQGSQLTPDGSLTLAGAGYDTVLAQCLSEICSPIRKCPMYGRDGICRRNQ
jgi:hypothetical protein